MASNDKEAVLAAVNGYLASMSNTKPPFTNMYKYILPESYAVITRPQKIFHFTLKDFVPHLEEMLARVFAAGATTGVVLTEPGPDVWIHERFAAVWSGYSSDVNGVERGRGANAYTLLKGEDGWKIAGVADTQFTPGETPSLTTEATAELKAPILELIQLINNKKWNEISGPLLPGGGATHAKFPNTVSASWDEFYSTLRKRFESISGDVEQRITEWEGRILGDLGFIWASYTVSVDSETKEKGCNVFTLLERDGKWLISGLQTA